MKELVPLVSIIIPCYNDAKHVEQAVDSALNQTYSSKEVIVVDDGSNEFTKGVLKKLEPKITKLITQENHGQSTARNIGIKESKGNYILVLDSDDFFEPSFCEKAIVLFKQNKSIKIVTCQANLIFEDVKSYVFKPRGGTINNFLYSSDALGTSMFKKNDWENCGGYDEKMTKGFEDWEFFIRILKNEGVAEVIQEPLFNYRKRFDSTTSRANKIKQELLEYIIIKHKDLYLENFELTIKHLLSIAERNKKDELKRLNSIDFRLGKIVLKPIRFIKKILKT